MNLKVKSNYTRRDLQLVFQDDSSPVPGEQEQQKHVFNHACASSKKLSCKDRKQNFCSFLRGRQYKHNQCLHSKSFVFSMQYLHILQGNDVHPTLGSSLHQLGAERVHDDNSFQNWGLAFLPGLQECFCFVLIVTKHSGDLDWKKKTQAVLLETHGR